MPASYKSGDREVAIDPLNLRFTVNYPSEELREAVTRFKDTIFYRKIVDTPSVAINEIRIELKEKTAEFVVLLARGCQLDLQGRELLSDHP